MADHYSVQLLDLLLLVQTKGYENALDYMMSEWVMRQGQAPLFLLYS
jgi:hypothetical protein